MSVIGYTADFTEDFTDNSLLEIEIIDSYGIPETYVSYGQNYEKSKVVYVTNKAIYAYDIYG